MADMLTSFKAGYIAGETAKLEVHAPGASAVSVVVGASTVPLVEGEEDVWSVTVPTTQMIGAQRWAVMVTGEDSSVACLARGEFTVMCAGRSPLREVVAAIDEAIRTWGTNPNRSISVGEIRIDYKSLSDLMAVRAQYIQQAEEQETGRASTGGLRMVRVVF